MNDLQSEQLKDVLGMDKSRYKSIDDFNEKEAELIEEIGICFYAEFSVSKSKALLFDSLLMCLNETEKAYTLAVQDELEGLEDPKDKSPYVLEYMARLRNLITYIILVSGKYTFRNINDELEAAREWNKAHGKKS